MFPSSFAARYHHVPFNVVPNPPTSYSNGYFLVFDRRCRRLRWSHRNRRFLHVWLGQPLRLAVAVSLPPSRSDKKHANPPRFVLEGIPAVIVGVLIYFFLPDFVETAKFLTQEERTIWAEIMGPYAPKGVFSRYTSSAWLMVRNRQAL